MMAPHAQMAMALIAVPAPPAIKIDARKKDLQPGVAVQFGVAKDDEI